MSSKVAVLKTAPDRVVEDYAKLMKLADFESALPRDADTILKINISWQYYFPACSTTPWQLDGVTAALRVNASVHNPLLCVVDVFKVASGDLSLPAAVNQ